MQQKEVNTRVKNKMPNTEKPTPIAEKKRMRVTGNKKHEENKIPVQKKTEVTKEKTEKKENVPEESKEEKIEDKKETKKQIQKKQKIKREEVVVRGTGLPISTKHSMSICWFIKGKEIEKAISDLEEVIKLRKSIPMRGEIPHRRGPGKIASGSGRYPVKASKGFIILLRNLLTNANAGDMENPVITEAVANIGVRPYGKAGRVRKKRTHIKIVAHEKKSIKNKMKKKNRKWKKEKL